MKILTPILSSEKPESLRGAGAKRNEKYEKVLEQALKTAKSKMLPIECDNLDERKKLFAALRYRVKKDSLSLYITCVGNTVYIQKV